MSAGKWFNYRHQCGHDQDVWVNTDSSIFAEQVAHNHARTMLCRRCESGATTPIASRLNGVRDMVAAPAPVASVAVSAPVAIDLTTPAGSQMSLVNAVQDGWTDEEIAARVRFNNAPTFICDGCDRRFPRALAMSASLGTSCPDCYDRLSDI